MAVYKRGDIYWISFQFAGKHYQESTGESNRKKALEKEEDRRSELRNEHKEREEKAKQFGCRAEDILQCCECDKLFNGTSAVEAPEGQIFCDRGCRDKWIKRLNPVPTLKEFSEIRFLPWAESSFAEKVKTWKFYRNGVRRLNEFVPLASRLLDEITGEDVASYIAKRQRDGLVTSSVNRELQVLRRCLFLAVEWGVISNSAKIKMLPGEHRRERVVTPAEESRYLAAAPDLLASITAVLIDSGMRPEECFRLRWENVTWVNGRHGSMRVTHGKTAAARRVLPMTPRVRTILETTWTREGKPEEGWCWPAPTQSGHCEPSTIRDHHEQTFKAIAQQAKENGGKPVRPFVLYSLRHTFLTRLGESGCDAWTLARIAGHSNISMSSRYVHPSSDAMLNAFDRMDGKKISATSESGVAEQRPRLLQ